MSIRLLGPAVVVAALCPTPCCTAFSSRAFHSQLVVVRRKPPTVAWAVSKEEDDFHNSTRATYLSSLMRQRGRLDSDGLLPPPPGMPSSGSDGAALPDLTAWPLFQRAPPASSKASQRKPNHYKDKYKSATAAHTSKQNTKSSKGNKSNFTQSTSGLPPLSQLFGVDTNNAPNSSATFHFPLAATANAPFLDGVLPVSELFYRSSQAMSTQDDDFDTDLDSDQDTDTYPIRLQSTSSIWNQYDEEYSNSSFSAQQSSPKIPIDSDDDELPFSAEQSDKILIPNNKVKVRRNLAQQFQVDKNHETDYHDDDEDNNSSNSSSSNISSSSNNIKNNAKDDYHVPSPDSLGEQSKIHQDSDFKEGRESFIGDPSSTSTAATATTTPTTTTTTSPTTTTTSSSTSKKDIVVPTSKLGSSLDKKTTSKKRGSSPPPSSFKELANFSNRSMKMVRRGMEMLVGGIPINVDPPLRFIELSYNFSALQTLISSQKTGTGHSFTQPVEEATPWALQEYLNNPYMKLKSTMDVDWAQIITTNSRDFGPLVHGPSVHKTSTLSRSIYCEYMGMAFIKWAVGPKDYEDIITSFESSLAKNIRNDDEKQQLDNLPSTMMIRKPLETITVETKFMSVRSDSNMSPPSSFHLLKDDDVEVLNDEGELLKLGGDLKFSMDISRPELEATFNGESGLVILNRVICQGIANAIKADTLGYNVTVTNIILNEVDGGATEFTVEFQLSAQNSLTILDAERMAKKINAALAQAMDDGEVALAMGAAAKVENSWPITLRDRIIEEFLFEVDDADDVKSAVLDDEDDFESFRDKVDERETSSKDRQMEKDVFDGPFGMPGDTIYGKNDIFLGGGNGGVFFDYSEKGLERAPFKGSLGPLLLDSVVQRSLQRHPRLIAIGDVHGCIDELQALLRKCDYRIGDLVLFLGDLVSKGPDSLSVVQMAREIGAIGVRGNHDFEVIRWHQAIKSGADPPVIGSEHFQIATQLSKADLRWMYTLPWYISSKDLGALFVHAGFVSGIRLAKQNPRLMMNMRSILPDGTVTSKFFKVWPWARLWDGPQTVFFGHDADRGLQQYEHAIGLDTGCVYGGKLTACILPEKRFVSVNAKKQYFQYRRRHFD